MGVPTETLADCRIPLTHGFVCRLIVEATKLTLEHLHMEFSKFSYTQNEIFVAWYYDHICDNFTTSRMKKLWPSCRLETWHEDCVDVGTYC
jgi:hypothetical protein